MDQLVEIEKLTHKQLRERMVFHVKIIDGQWVDETYRLGPNDSCKTYYMAGSDNFWQNVVDYLGVPCVHLIRDQWVLGSYKNQVSILLPKT